jgi:hypothetical protein
MSNGIDFTKDYRKDPYNIKNIEKNIDDKSILATLVFLNMWNSKILKFKEYLKIPSKF